MKNKNITWKISQGVYVLTTKNGGCIVDAVSQISSGDNPLISVSVMNSNFTKELINKNQIFAISILGKDVDGDIIETFGFNSMRDIDKFANIKTQEVEGLKIINDSLGYMICEVVDAIKNDTHTLFIGRLIEADKFSDAEILTYQYYQEHKEEYIKVKTNSDRIAWICTICGYVYYGDKLPKGFKCPKCGVDQTLFQKKIH